MDMSETVKSNHIQSLPPKMGIEETLRGEVRMNESMKKYTSWRAGGQADRIYIPADLADLSQFLLSIPKRETVHVVGLGSNLLVRDGGLRGTVILPHAKLNKLRLEQHSDEDGLIYVEAGVTCAKVARFSALNNLAGAEFLAGIPGTVGGALAMNAGCYGLETWEIIEGVRTLNRSGCLKERDSKEYKTSYRKVSLKSDIGLPVDSSSEEWFVGAWIRLKKGNDTTSRKKIKELLSKRINSQPLNLPSAGSVFRNPPGDYAARLIELCELKGFSIGGAMVSSKHANFIVNTGNAMAEDIEAVIAEISKKVKRKTGIKLVQEIRIIGEAK
ncbi:MAG: UDP-N-acetylmuramate dehydrogenase [Burkholderiales bacterium]|jgi:UDP-N-acetylmuramate dehydrogenase|tara:strand:+ start:1698 stop:2684 length:987 start_codon:yes stop_codon:yes gene_type:complete